MTGERLAKKIKQQGRSDNDLSDLVFGVVTSTSPLRIKVDSRFEIGSTHILLSRMVKNLTVSITIDGKTGSATIFRALQAGDKVRMLRLQKGQIYYVLERG